jgi:phospholipid transport system substrate-binding protein
MSLKLTLNIACGLFAFSVFTLQANGAQAKGTLESARERMRVIANDKGTIEQKQASMRKLTRELLDFTYVSEQTLGANWAKLSAKQQKEFAAVLEELVEASYLGKVNDAGTSDITFGEETKTAEGTEVTALAHAQGSEVHLIFKLKPKGSGWLVTDVVIDDVSLVRNYRAQFQKTLTKSTLAELQTKLQKKAAELRGATSSESTAKN